MNSPTNSLSIYALDIIKEYSDASVEIPGNQLERVRWITNINWGEPSERGAYVKRYFKRYAQFIKQRLQDFFEIQQMQDRLVFADLGCGPGTASIALLDIIREGIYFPNINHIIIELVDHKAEAIKIANEIILRFVNMCLKGVHVEIVFNLTFLNEQTPKFKIDPNLILCTNMLCEINNEIPRKKLEKFFQNTKSGFFISDCYYFDDFDRFCQSLSIIPTRVDVRDDTGYSAVLKYSQRSGRP